MALQGARARRDRDDDDAKSVVFPLALNVEISVRPFPAGSILFTRFLTVRSLSFSLSFHSVLVQLLMPEFPGVTLREAVQHEGWRAHLETVKDNKQEYTALFWKTLKALGVPVAYLHRKSFVHVYADSLELTNSFVFCSVSNHRKLFLALFSCVPPAVISSQRTSKLA